MSEPVPVSPRLSPEQYLEMERASDVRHEYVRGHVHLMAGARVAHMQITGNLLVLLRRHLAGRPCRVFTNELKLRPTYDRFYYPDVIVCCQPLADQIDLVTDARYVFEISSPSTQRADLSEKAEAYWQVPSLEAYVMVIQDALQVVVMRRGEGDWETEILTRPDDTLRLEGIGFTTTLAAIYEGTDVRPA